MTVFLLLMILLVLLIATGLLPGAFKIVTAALSLAALAYMIAAYGWLYVLYVGGAVIIAAAAQAGYSHWQKRHAARKAQELEDWRIQSELEKRERQLAEKQSAKEAAITRQIEQTNSIGKTPR